MPKTKQSQSSAPKAEGTKGTRKKGKRGERYHLLTKPKTRSPRRRAEVSTINTKGVSTNQGSSGVVSLSSVNNKSCRKKRKLKNTEQQRNLTRLCARVHPQTKPKHQVKTKPSNKNQKPAPEIKWGGKSETEALNT